jgi:hypothetical protein
METIESLAAAAAAPATPDAGVLSARLARLVWMG